jgi:hypothetical protein
LLDLDEAALADLGLAAVRGQPDANQIRQGTIIHRRWHGEGAAVLLQRDIVRFKIQREPDASIPHDANVVYGIAVSVEMPGEDRVYEQVRARVMVAPRIKP